VEVSDRHVYDIGNGSDRHITKHGPLDPRLGTSSRGSLCETCNREMKDCNGHFGYVKLSLPAFHVGYLKKIIEGMTIFLILGITLMTIFSSTMYLQGKTSASRKSDGPNSNRNVPALCWMSSQGVHFSRVSGVKI